MKDCIFCKIVNGEVPSEKAVESSNFFIVNDNNPVSEGHCLVISKEHYETIFDLPSELGKEFVEILKWQGQRLIKEGKADGIKLVNNNYKASGQVVKHFHVHIIPEKEGVERKRFV